MRTSEEIYHRVKWDPRFDPARFVLGVATRGGPVKRVPMAGFTPGGDVPWHRIVWIEADGVPVWDRERGIDLVGEVEAGLVRMPRLLPARFFQTGGVFSWAQDGGWRTREDGRKSVGGPLRVLTWNTLWDRYDSDKVFTARRRPWLLDVLEQADADVVALQEVEKPLLDSLLQAPWVRERYTLSTGIPRLDVADSGLLLLSRLPVREVGRHSLGPYKAVAAMTVETVGGPVVVATTHLSSDHSHRGEARRRGQLGRLAEILAGLDCDVVLMGDFNDGSSLPTEVLGLRDAWVEARGEGDVTPTFDPVVNPLAAVSSLSGVPARLDRVLLRGPDLHVGAVELLGDVPDGEGLYISDHYGVFAELYAEDARSAGVGVRPTARTAVAWVPGEEVGEAVQPIRRERDPQVDRWPPHVNVLFGFVPESSFEDAAAGLRDAAGEVPPFTARLEGVQTFTHRQDATLWLDPAAAGAGPWRDMQRALESRFPQCKARTEGYTPHLTLGKVPLDEPVEVRLPVMKARVEELLLLSRRGDEPMQARAALALGSGELRWLDPKGSPLPGRPRRDDRPENVLRRLRKAVPEGDFRVTGSRRMGCELEDSDLDLVVSLPEGIDLRQRVENAFPETHVTVVEGARVPGIRLRVAALGVDIAVVHDEAGSGEAAKIALSAITDADEILAAVGERKEEFASLARAVKAWARARGLDSAPFGGLPGLAWAVLAARTVQEGGSAEDFFATWAAWDWRRPIALRPDAPAAPDGSPLRILTPTEPVRSCTEQVGPDMLDLLARELFRAWELLEAGGDPWPELLAPPPLHRRHAAWAVLTVQDEAVGRARGRLRALLAFLEESGARDVHAWPRPFESGRGRTRYAIGLGRDPLDAADLAEVAERWAVPGAELTWAAGGEVPTLR
ncbi:poly(A) polymerase [Actinocorallia populi]|uniref:poly(A) polymerase n=1 Tax=Actinocorallia populi TaxID=2079200 RepID=UPI000D09261C|nr:poly(A) polymerase [Actinocorallia populi]